MAEGFPSDEGIDIESLPIKFRTRMSAKEKLAIRKQYRSLISEVEENKEMLLKPECPDLLDHVKKADDIFSRVNSSREARLDSKFMRMTVAIAEEKTKRIETELVTFNSDEFLEKLVTKMNGRYIGEHGERVQIPDESWIAVGQYLRQFYNFVTPALSVMSGTFKVPPQPTSQEATESQEPSTSRPTSNPERRQRSNSEQPESLHDEEDEERKEATPEEIERVLNRIRQLYDSEPFPINYFELVVNPMSFGHTIENIFHLSFLVKDGLVRVYIDSNDIPVVEPIDRNQDGGEQVEARSNQVMVSLSMEEWREIIDVFDLQGKDPLIEPKNPLVQQPAVSQSVDAYPELMSEDGSGAEEP